jgi:N-acetylglucosamine-6-sulfatase
MRWCSRTTWSLPEAEIVTSDNGFFLGEHRVRQEKTRAHEPSLRVPLLITGPGMRQGARRYDPISTVDLTRTIIDLAGAGPPHTPDGASLVPTMRYGDRGWIHAVLTEGFNTSGGAFDTGLSSIGVRTARYSYINYATGIDELYDLKVDPYEDTNRIGDPRYATRRRQLKALAWRLHDCVGQECRFVLPRAFARPADRTKALTEQYWAAIYRRFGFN